MSTSKWSMLYRKTGVGEGTEGQMGRGNIIFISYLDSKKEISTVKKKSQQ